jgi:hypothetical protein
MEESPNCQGMKSCKSQRPRSPALLAVTSVSTSLLSVSFINISSQATLGRKYKVYFVVPSEDPTVRWLRVNVPFGMLDIFGGYDRGGPAVEVDSGRGDAWDIPKVSKSSYFS